MAMTIPFSCSSSLLICKNICNSPYWQHCMGCKVFFITSRTKFCDDILGRNYDIFHFQFLEPWNAHRVKRWINVFAKSPDHDQPLKNWKWNQKWLRSHSKISSREEMKRTYVCPRQLINLDISNFEYRIYVVVSEGKQSGKKNTQFKIRHVQIDELSRNS